MIQAALARDEADDQLRFRGKATLPKPAPRKRYVDTDEFISAVARMVRAAGRRAADSDPEQLAQLIEIRRSVDAAIQEAVDGLRRSGITWQSIGEATGTTRQAAIQKWSPSR